MVGLLVVCWLLEICGNSVLTERTIQTVAKVASISVDKSIRDGAVRSALHDRKSKPKLEVKSDFISKA